MDHSKKRRVIVKMLNGFDVELDLFESLIREYGVNLSWESYKEDCALRGRSFAFCWALGVALSEKWVVASLKYNDAGILIHDQKSRMVLREEEALDYLLLYPTDRVIFEKMSTSRRELRHFLDKKKYDPWLTISESEIVMPEKDNAILIKADDRYGVLMNGSVSFIDGRKEKIEKINARMITWQIQSY